jgi:hypothetical protein
VVSDIVTVSAIGAMGLIAVSLITTFGHKLSVKQDELGKRMDGRLDELLELTRKSSRAEGFIEGKDSK